MLLLVGHSSILIYAISKNLYLVDLEIEDATGIP